MGPRFIDRGKVEADRRVLSLHSASMGPRFIDRGKMSTPTRKGTVGSLQWGRGSSTAERRLNSVGCQPS